MEQRRTRYIPPSERNQTEPPAAPKSPQPAEMQTPPEPAPVAPPEPTPVTPPEPDKPKKGHGKAIVILAIVLVILAGLGFVAYKKAPYLLDRLGVMQEDRPFTLVIQRGDYEYKATDTLQEEQIIKSGADFRKYIQNNAPGFVYTPGEYLLNANMSFADLLSALQHPDVAYQYVTVAVPEGRSIWKIAQLMEDNGVCGYQEFLTAANDYDYDFDFVRQLASEDSDLICYKLEGFLYPATYDLRVGMDARDVVKTMLAAFDTYLPADALDRCAARNVSFRQMMTLASVIQAESYGQEMMKGVSSVFWNRLESPNFMPKLLQSDPTTTYSKAIAEEVPGASDEMVKAYDTYQITGIPAGSINNPGAEAIDAALHPADTNYLYFVTDTEHNIYYAVTLQEHNANCRRVGLM